jgi:sulfate-transporting ATPase
VARTFQNLELFEDLTVRENLLAACDSHDRGAYLTTLFRPGRSGLPPLAGAAAEALGLDGELDTIVSGLPQGRRRLLAIARLIARSPSVICLDEPAAGLSGPERKLVAQLFRSLAEDFGAAVLLVEHNVDVVSETCDELLVLDFGRVIASGASRCVLNDPVVREAYLGSRPVDLEFERTS